MRCSFLGAIMLAALGVPGVARAQPAEATFRVRQADPATFVVQRVRPDGVSTEGFVVDSDALVETLRTRVLVEQGLGKLARIAAVRERVEYEPDWLQPREDAAEDLSYGDTYSFGHSFAAPFEQLKARVDLASLEDGSGEGSFLYPVAALLALAIVLGLFALYRMVAVQVGFAERRSNFVAAVSHELKTPLTAIRMYAEMLRDDLVESEDKRCEYYATISSETERLGRLINNVLELSRLERDERPMRLVVGDPAALVTDTVNMLRPHAEREGFRLEVNVEPGLPAARFDRDALIQVLFNLLDNALKYGRVGTDKQIQVRCAAVGGGVQISVIDHGEGVPAAQLDAIFEPFYRAQNELTRTQPGTGIGLSLVRSLVERMHGRVEGRNLRPGFEVRVTLQAG